jgi:hypothetical protein
MGGKRPMLKRSLQVLIVLALSAFVSWVNFSAYLKGYEPDIRQMAASLVFLVFWFGYGLWMGVKKDSFFLKFSTLYWGLGIAAFLLGKTTDSLVGVIAACLFFGPVYGINYFFNANLHFSLYVFIAYGIGLAGFFLGRYGKNTKGNG